jgi:hypothetical protein
MQVQVIENQAHISGKISDVKPHKELAHYYTVTLNVETVSSVEGYANLLTWAKGLAVEVTASTSDMERLHLAPGQKVTLHVKKTGPTSVFLVPPKPEDKK